MARSRAKDAKRQGRTLQDPPRSGAGSYVLELSLGQQGCPCWLSSTFLRSHLTRYPVLLARRWEAVWGMAPLEDYLSKS